MNAGRPVELRSARADEFAAVAAFHWTVWHETQARFQPAAVAAYRDRAFFVARIGALPQPPLVALREGAIIGFAGWSGAVIGQVYVSPEARGLGTGARLLAAAEAAIGAAGHPSAALFVIAGNERARAFYLRQGWQEARMAVLDVPTREGIVAVEAHEMVKAVAPT